MALLTAYLIGGNPVGTVVTSWGESQLGGNSAFRAEDTITSGYQDISSAINWDKFGLAARGGVCSLVRESIKGFYEAGVWANFSATEKEIFSRWFVNSKTERDLVKTAEEQEQDALELANCLAQENSDSLTTTIVNSDGGDSLTVIINEGSSGVPFQLNTSYVDEDNNASDSFENILTLSANNLISGEYEITWYYELSTSINNKSILGIVELNDSEIGRFEGRILSDHWNSVSGSYISQLSGNNSIKISYKRTMNSTTAKIRRSRLKITRIG